MFHMEAAAITHTTSIEEKNSARAYIIIVISTQ
jgi:hypothetical protein